MWTKRDGALFLEGGREAMFQRCRRVLGTDNLRHSESNRMAYENEEGKKIDPFALKETYEIL